VTTPVNRPNRIGVEGVTKQWSFREDEALTLAALAQAEHDGTTLSEIMRDRLRGYMEDSGWDIPNLISKDPERINAEWVARLRRKAPKERVRKGRHRRIADHATMELF
jgi:hypothetical protein